MSFGIVQWFSKHHDLGFYFIAYIEPLHKSRFIKFSLKRYHLKSTHFHCMISIMKTNTESAIVSSFQHSSVFTKTTTLNVALHENDI